MSKYLTPEIEENALGLKLKSKPIFEDNQNKKPENIQDKTNPQNTPPKAEIKKTKKQATPLEQILNFILLSSIIFIITFLVMNFSAYKEIALNLIFPERQAIQSLELNQAVGNKKVKQILFSVNQSKKVIKKEFPPLNLTITPPDNRIVIPKLGKNIPLVEMDADNLKGENWTELEDQIQDGLRQGVVHYPGTALPGQIGNVFITGHSSYYPWDKGEYKDVFALLPKLEVGDKYYVFYNQKKHTYQITSKKEVYPNNVQVLHQPDNTKISTLMTCVPVGTALRRLILEAQEI